MARMYIGTTEVTPVMVSGYAEPEPDVVYTGHADAAGLAAIGWTDDDIAYYQKYGVDWDEEDDSKHLVSDANKALATLTYDQMAQHKDVLVYLPKNGALNGLYYATFQRSVNLVAVPGLEIQSLRNGQLLFQGCYSLKSVGKWTGNCTSFVCQQMFDGCRSLRRIDFSELSCPTSGLMRNVFVGCTMLEEVIFPAIKWGTMYEMFYNCRSLKKVDFSRLIIPDSVTSVNFYHTFSGCHSLKKIDLSRLSGKTITECNTAWSNTYALRKLDLTGVTVKCPANSSSLFINCCGIQFFDMSGFDTSAVTNMSYMFQGCCMTKIDLSGFDATKVTTVECMFDDCLSLKSLDLSNFVTTKLTSSGNMLRGTTALETVNLSGFTTQSFTSAGTLDLFAGGGANVTSLTVSANMFSAPNLVAYSFAGLAKWTDVTQIQALIDALPERTVTRTLKLHANTKAVMTDAMKTSITDKGWTLA